MEPISFRLWVESLGPFVPATWAARAAQVSRTTWSRAVASGRVRLERFDAGDQVYAAVKLDELRRFMMDLRGRRRRKLTKTRKRPG